MSRVNSNLLSGRHCDTSRHHKNLDSLLMIRSMVMNIIAWESRNNCFLFILRDGIAIKQSYLLKYFALLFCVMMAQGVWRSNEILAAVVMHSVVPDTDMKIWKSEAVENEAFSLNIPLKNYRNGGSPQSGWMRGIPRRRRRLWKGISDCIQCVCRYR